MAQGQDAGYFHYSQSFLPWPSDSGANTCAWLKKLVDDKQLAQRRCTLPLSAVLTMKAAIYFCGSGQAGEQFAWERNNPATCFLDLQALGTKPLGGFDATKMV
jgi:hypothetical protein